MLQKDIIRLEGEVLRAKRLSFTTERPHDLSISFTDAGSASSPSGPLSTNEDVRKLQQENQELRDKLVSFDCEYIKSLRVFSISVFLNV